MADTPVTAESAYRHQWACVQYTDALVLRQAEIARAERALADARRRLVIAEDELQAALDARID